MKARYVYMLLFLIPAITLGFLSGLLGSSLTASFFWLFVYGNDSWPPNANHTIILIGLVTAVATCLVLLYASYSVGRRRDEEAAGVNRRHVELAVGLIAFTAVAWLLYFSGWMLLHHVL